MKTKLISTFIFFMLIVFTAFGNTLTTINHDNTLFTPSVCENFFQDTTDMSAFSVWRRTNWYLGGTKPEIIEIYVDRDTILNDRVCRILKTKFDDIVIEDSDLPVYYKDEKMYFHEDGKWWLLYDFTAKQGDTVTFYLSKKAGLYFVGRPDNPPLEENPYKIIIKKIDTVFTSGGQPLKRFLTAHPEFGETNVYGMYEVIEDVGSLFGLFGHYYIFTALDWRYEFLCFKNEHYVYPDEASCQLTSTLDWTNELVKIFPNPGQDVISVRWENNQHIPLSYKMYNLMGQPLLTGQSANSTFEISVDILPAGLYLVFVEDSNGKVFSSKWVKQE